MPGRRGRFFSGYGKLLRRKNGIVPLVRYLIEPSKVKRPLVLLAVFNSALARCLSRLDVSNDRGECALTRAGGNLMGKHLAVGAQIFVPAS